MTFDLKRIMILEPNEGYISFIVNPASGKSSSNGLVRRFRDYLVDKGYDVRTNLTRSLAHARELAQNSAVEHRCRMVIASGGDGTIREIAHGLEGSDKLLMFVPSGTENLLANEMGYDEKLSTLIGAFESGQTRNLDLGVANGRCFTSIASFGFDGDVVKRVHSRRDGNITHFDYFWPLWRTFWEHTFPDISVEVDGEEIYSGPGMVFVGNISRYALGLQILRRADYGDGLIDICIYKCGSQLHLLKHSFLTLFKRHIDAKDVIYKQGKTVKIIGVVSVVNTELDGDPGPTPPVEIKIMPQSVKVVVPPDSKPAGIRTRLIRALG